MCFVNIYIQYSLTKYRFRCASEREREREREGGGGGGGGNVVLWIINGTLLFLRKNNLSLLFSRNINWGSYEKIIWFYFLYEILKESIFFKKIS